MNEETFTRTNNSIKNKKNHHTNYRPRLGRLFKNKMHLACIQPQRSITLIWRPNKSLPSDATLEEDWGTEVGLFFFVWKLLNVIMKITLVPQMCELLLRGKKKNYLHCFIAHGDEEEEERISYRKPDLRVESELDRQIFFFFFFTNNIYS